MYVKVAFRLQPKGLVEVPAAALIFRASGPQVARVDADGKVEFVKVDDRPRQRQPGGSGSEREAGRSAGAEHQQPDRCRSNRRRERSRGRAGRQKPHRQALRGRDGESATSDPAGADRRIDGMRGRGPIIARRSRTLRRDSSLRPLRLNRTRLLAAAAAGVDLAVWWRSLNDAELESLVERAVKSNLDLQIALDRLQQARTYEALVVGHALPQVDATAGEGRGTGSDLTAARAAQGLRSADNSSAACSTSTRIAGFDAVWEIDIFGKYRREIEAARFDSEAAAAARYAVITAVVADVVRAYVDLRGLQIAGGDLAAGERCAARVAAHREHPLSARHHQRAGRDAGDPRARDVRFADSAGGGAGERGAVCARGIAGRVSRKHRARSSRSPS